MKKFFGVICVLIMMFAVTSCDEILSENSKKDIVSAGTNDNNSQISDNTEKTSLSMEEQVIWEVDGVKITATSITENTLFGTQVNLLVENNSDKDIGTGSDAVIVNDYMISDLTSITVTAGNKSNSSVTLLSSELEAAGIENIGKVELYFHTFDPETYMTGKSSDCITLNLSGIEKIDTQSNIEGTVLYEGNEVKIVGQYVDENSFWGSSVLLYIENNSDKNIIVQNEDLSVNGFMVTSLMSQNIYSGKKAITAIHLLKTDLETNNITSIENIETSFKIITENFEKIANSGKVNFSVK